MTHQFKEGDWVEVNVNDNPLENFIKPEWVKVQIAELVTYGRDPGVPAYRLTKEPKPGYGLIYLEAFVRKAQ